MYLEIKNHGDLHFASMQKWEKRENFHNVIDQKTVSQQ